MSESTYSATQALAKNQGIASLKGVDPAVMILSGGFIAVFSILALIDLDLVKPAYPR